MNASVGLTDLQGFVAKGVDVEEELKGETPIAMLCKLKMEMIVCNPQNKAAPEKQDKPQNLKHNP